MNLIKKISFTAIKQLDINFLKKYSPVNVLNPYHHLVSDVPVPHVQHLYKFKNSKQFESDLDYLLRNFSPVTIADIIQSITSGISLPKKSFLIHFDDALKEVYEVAMPILLRKGVPAALFVVPKFIDNAFMFNDFKRGLILNKILTGPASFVQMKQAEIITRQKKLTQYKLSLFVLSLTDISMINALGNLLNIDFADFLKTQKPFMSLQQLKEFQSKGFFIGAHSMDHFLYGKTPLPDQLKQTLDSLNWVSEKMSNTDRVFSFPYVDKGVKNEFFENIFNSGLQGKPDLIFGNQSGMLEKHPRVLHRFIGENPDTSIEAMCKAVLGYSLLNQKLNRQYVQRY